MNKSRTLECCQIILNYYSEGANRNFYSGTGKKVEEMLKKYNLLNTNIPTEFSVSNFVFKLDKKYKTHESSPYGTSWTKQEIIHLLRVAIRDIKIKQATNNKPIFNFLSKLCQKRQK